MRALSIRQPFAELILRGIKTVELRSISTKIIGQRFYIYAPQKKASADLKVWSRDLSTGGTPVPQWMIELAEQVGMIEPGAILPRGVIVGMAKVASCQLLVSSEGAAGNSKLATGNSIYAWHLVDVQRTKTLRRPKLHPQPVWFKPF